MRLKLIAGLFLYVVLLSGCDGSAPATTKQTVGDVEVSQNNLSREQVSAIIADFSASEPASFSDFLTSIKSADKYPLLTSSIEEYLAANGAQGLSETDSHKIYRLLGIYTRMKYGSAAINTLTELVRIPTFKVEGIEAHNNPHIIQLGKSLEQICNEFGLQFKNIDNRVFKVSLGPDAEAGEVIALHAHADVVPVNKSLWVLEDGTQLDPFEVTTIDGKMYGRGTEDDKNAIVVTLYAMKTIIEEKIALKHSFHLLVDTTEETAGTAIPYYLSKYPTPAYNLALDGSYPVIIAEKGYGTVMAEFPVRAGEGQGAEIVHITGGLATNQIPAEAMATLRAQNIAELKDNLDPLIESFVAENGANFSMTSQVVDDDLVLTFVGISAHSSDPESGVNPVSRMMAFLDSLKGKIAIKDNHLSDAARYATQNWGINYYGEALAVNFSDDFMGPLTASQTFVDINDQRLRIATNLRVPVGKDIEQLKVEITQKLQGWQQANPTDFTFSYSQREAMYRNPEGKWVNTLLDVASENLPIERKFGSSSGATSIHDLPNGVQFGLTLPDEKYTGHNANEFKSTEQFLMDLHIVTEMMARLGNQQPL